MEVKEIKSTFKNNFICLTVDLVITVDDLMTLKKLLSTTMAKDITYKWQIKNSVADAANNTNNMLEFMDSMAEYIKLMKLPNEKDVYEFLDRKYNELNEAN